MAQEIQKVVICGFFDWFEPHKKAAEGQDSNGSGDVGEAGLIGEAVQNLVFNNFRAILFSKIEGLKSTGMREAIKEHLDFYQPHTVQRALEKYDRERGASPLTFIVGPVERYFISDIQRRMGVAERAKQHTEVAAGTLGVGCSVIDSATSRPDETTRAALAGEVLKDLLGELDVRDQRILTWRFGLSAEDGEKTLEEIGTTLGLTRERVRQLQASAMKRLRAAAQQRGIDPEDFLIR